MPYTGADYRKNVSKLAQLTPEQVLKIHEITNEAFARFDGSIDELESAIGFLYMGHQLGWKPLALMHNKRTIRRYEEILQIEAREVFPPEGPSVTRSLGYTIALKIGSFWKAVSGELKDDELKENRRTIAKG